MSEFKYGHRTMKQTAVEWLHTKLSTCTSEELVGNINNWFEQAKEMEKEQMIEAIKIAIEYAIVGK
jgi:hypothetical protein